MDNKIVDLDKLKKRLLRKYPVFGSVISGVKYYIVDKSSDIETAATDGTAIYVNSDYFSTLTESEKDFVVAHEVCHIALRHIERSKDRDDKIWNEATDAVINQYLKRDGLPMPKGVVNIEDAINYDAEEMYERLKKEKENLKSKGKMQGIGGSGGKGLGGESDQVGHDDHSLWKKAVAKIKEKEDKDKNKGEDKDKSDDKKSKISEREIFEKNREMKIKRAEEVMSKINSDRRGMNGDSQKVYFENIGSASKPVANWKKVLVRSLEIEDEHWGHKFSDRSNGYAARIEDIEYEEKAETEIILDVSGSVSVDLLRSFLRQVKTVLKNSNIKVGTFADEFHGFTEIKRESDIDKLIFDVGGGTNFNAASCAFSKQKDVNKICFTDGQDSGDAGIINKRKDIVWVSFENKDFKPDNGKVIYVPPELIELEDDSENSL